MGAVAARAGGDAVSSRRQLFAVHARDVLGGLIDALLRCEPAHQLRVAVAARAGGDLRLAGRRALESVRRVVRTRLVAGRRIAAVTIDAREAALAVDVRSRRKRGRRRQLRIGCRRRVAGGARVGRRRRLRAAPRGANSSHRGEERKAASMICAWQRPTSA